MAKSKKKSPTALSLERLRAEGFVAQVVEQTIPHCFIKRDFIGCIDLIAFNNVETIGIQATSGSNHAARRTKALAIPDLTAWLSVPGRAFEVWSWTQPAGKGTKYVLRRERFTLEEAKQAAFATHLEWASEEVAKWPEWKRNLLGGVS